MDREKQLMHLTELSEEEKRAIHNPEDYPIISVIKGLSSDEKKRLYASIRIKKESFRHFLETEKKWLGEHEVYLDEQLRRNNLDDSHEAIEKMLYEEILNGNGENVRFRIFYAARYTENIEPPMHKELTDFLAETGKAVETSKSSKRVCA